MENTNNRKVVVVVLVIAILAVVLMAGYLAFSSKKQVTNTTTTNSQAAPGASTAGKTAVTPTPPPPPKFNDKEQVSVSKQGFEPKVLRVKSGTLVNWINQSGAEVAIVSDPPGTHNAYPGLNLGRFPNGSGVSAIFNKTGTYGYHNYLNLEQKGTIVVE